MRMKSMAEYTESTLPHHLKPSKLGTKAYWDDSYAREISNNAANGEDEGTIWFSDSSAEEKMLDYLEALSDEGQLYKTAQDAPPENAPTNFLDLGTGNGHLLFALRDAGWEGHMVGVDYSAKSVELAHQIQQNRTSQAPQADGDDGGGATIKDEDEQPSSSSSSSTSSSLPPIHFSEYNILSPEDAGLPTAPPAGFDIVLDKGTFDAISLSSETKQDGSRICESYGDAILPLVRRDGLFLITSCNWTEEELQTWFEGQGSGSRRGGGFVLVDRVKYPSFTFGGKKGQTVVTLVFRNVGRR